MNKYIAFYNGRQEEVTSATLYGAKLAAIAIFRPRKSQEHMVSVVLAEKDGQPVTHTGE